LQQLVFLSKIYTSLLSICSILFYICYFFLIFIVFNLFKSANIYRLSRKKYFLLKLILLLTRNFDTFYIFRRSSRSFLQQQYYSNFYFYLFLNSIFAIFLFYCCLQNSIPTVAILSISVAIKRYSRSFQLLILFVLSKLYFLFFFSNLVLLLLC